MLIFGGSSGIGLATALRLAAAGARLVLSSRSAVALDRAARQCREAGAGDVHTVVADVLRADQVEQAVAVATRELGELDAVVYTAAVMAYGAVESVPVDVFATVVDTAVHGTLHVARAVLPVFRHQHRGTLVVVNSLLGAVTVPNMGAYATSKWGQRALVRTLQQELRRVRGVHVCQVSPGSVNTPVYYQAANYLGRQARPPAPVLQPETVARAVVGLFDHPRRNVSVPVGPANPLEVAGFRFVPRLYDTLVGPLFRVGALTRQHLPPTAGNVQRPASDAERVHGRWPQNT